MQRSRANSGRSCVFIDLAEQLESEAREMVHELMEKSDGPKEKALQANNAIENYMFDNCEWCIQPNKSAFCLVHKGLCPVNPGWALGERFSGTSPEQLQQKLSTGHGLQDCFEGVPAAAWWTSPDFKAEPEDTTPPLVVNISSLICLDFSLSLIHI